MSRSAAAHRAATWRKTALDWSAEFAGKTLAVGLRTFPGILGAAGASVAAGMVSLPLGIFVGSAFLLILDHRSSS